jgi:hypothetical protein
VGESNNGSKSGGLKTEKVLDALEGIFRQL